MAPIHQSVAIKRQEHGMDWVMNTMFHLFRMIYM